MDTSEEAGTALPRAEEKEEEGISELEEVDVSEDGSTMAALGDLRCVEEVGNSRGEPWGTPLREPNAEGEASRAFSEPG